MEFSAKVGGEGRSSGAWRKPNIGAIRSMRRRFRGLAGAGFPLAAGSLAEQAITALAMFLAARQIGPERFGHVAVAIAVAAVAATLLDFGANFMWLREMAAGRMTAGVYASFVVSKILISAIVLAGLALLTSQAWHWAIPAAAMAFGTTTWQVSQLGLRARLRFWALGFIMVAERASMLAIAMLAARVRTWEFGIWFSTSVTRTVFGLCLVAALFSSTSGWPRFANPWRGARHFGAAAVTNAVANFDIPLIRTVSTPTASGEYGAVSRWTSPISLFVSSLCQAIFPILSAAESGAAALRKARVTIVSLGVLSCASVAAAFASLSLVPILFGEAFAKSGVVLCLLFLAAAAATPGQFFAIFLQARSREALVARLWASAILLQLTLVIVGSQIAGSAGAASAVLFGQSTFAIVMAVSVRRQLRRER